MARSIGRTMRRWFRVLRSRRRSALGAPRLLRRLITRSVETAWQRPAQQRPTRSVRHSLRGVQHRIERAQGKLIDARYRNKFGARRYTLYVPTVHQASPLPLIVMLHGCSDAPEDFAAATGMNRFATAHGFAVVYPMQSAAANRSRCWNWFRAEDQQRGKGEPAILAGLTRHLVRSYGFDSGRVYVAGLSAGAAMAVILGRTYPELYAAIGVHSGLPYGAAHDVASAFKAMRGEPLERPLGANGVRLPRAFVIHGDRDSIVHPFNARRLCDQLTHRHERVLSAEFHRIDEIPGSRSCTRTVLRNADGIAMIEHWIVHGGGHAWFGGDPSVRHADGDGPNASQEMLRFFFERAPQDGSARQ